MVVPKPHVHSAILHLNRDWILYAFHPKYVDTKTFKVPIQSINCSWVKSKQKLKIGRLTFDNEASKIIWHFPSAKSNLSSYLVFLVCILGIQINNAWLHLPWTRCWKSLIWQNMCCFYTARTFFCHSELYLVKDFLISDHCNLFICNRWPRNVNPAWRPS